MSKKMLSVIMAFVCVLTMSMPAMALPEQDTLAELAEQAEADDLELYNNAGDGGISLASSEGSGSGDTAEENVSGTEAQIVAEEAASGNGVQAVTEETVSRTETQTVTEEAASGTETQAVTEEAASGTEEQAAEETAAEAAAGAETQGAAVTGTFEAVDGYDISTIRYVYNDGTEETYDFADFEFDEASDTYLYSFTAPAGFSGAVQGSNLSPADGANVIANYYSLSRWDGAVDISWYDPDAEDIYIYDPAQLAGVSAICSGHVDAETKDYEIKGERISEDEKQDGYIYESDLKYLVSTHSDNEALGGPGSGPCYVGLPENDFLNKTIHIMNDIDLGGTDGANIEHYTYCEEDNYYGRGGSAGTEYPNWMPIGGVYNSDPGDCATVVKSYFNGSVEGNGHRIINMYCYRRNYRASVNVTGGFIFAYSQGIGFIGGIASVTTGNSEKAVKIPTISDFSVSGYVYGRRMTGGVLGLAGGSNGNIGRESLECHAENIANHCYVYGTDAKGIGGICGRIMSKGHFINCYNTGYICTIYAEPAGGIAGVNEYSDLINCYNIGTVNTNNAGKGCGISADDGGSDYSVENCWYLEGCGDDKNYPGYYSANIPKSVSIDVNPVTAAEVSDGTLLSKLSIFGNSYVQGDEGYPVLYWEKNELVPCTVSVVQPSAGGTISVSEEGSVRTGTLLDCSAQAETGWACRYFMRNGNKAGKRWVFISEDTEITAFFETLEPGRLAVVPLRDFDISIVKNGIIMNDGAAETVENYPVVNGDAVFENDRLLITVTLKEGAKPDDESMIYQAEAGMENPYNYTFTYTGDETETQTSYVYDVDSRITGDGIILTLEIEPLLTEKLWRYTADTSWYTGSESEFTITTASQLGGLGKLVYEGNSFAGKTVKLGNDISLANDDGTDGIRYWDGIGTGTSNYFGGTFDGQGFTISDYNGTQYGLFAYCIGTASRHAVIKDLTIRGSVTGINPAGICYFSKYADISGCDVYMDIAVDGSSDYSGGIVGRDAGYSTITDCVNYGCIDSRGSFGGIAGYISVSGSVTDCINKGYVLCGSTANNQVGGLVGSLNGALVHCANYGNITACGRNIGGIAGQITSLASNVDGCYNVGTVTYHNGSTDQDAVGGIAGYASLYNIKNTYNFGKVINECPDVTSHEGGFAGRNARQSRSTLSDVYYLDSCSSYAHESLAYSELPDVTYLNGLYTASEASFASDSGVLAAINDDEAMSISNGKYPELAITAGTHVHCGGQASCSLLPVCEECGLSYGEFDPDVHLESVLLDPVDPVWVYDGNTGDTVCAGCGKVLVHGESIPADKEKLACTVTVRVDGCDEPYFTKEYSVEELDSMAETTPVGYTYGKTGESSRNKVVSDRYVTFEAIMEDVGVDLDKVVEFNPGGDGSVMPISKEAYLTEKYYYHENGTEMEVPAALLISYAGGTASLETLIKLTKVSGVLRLGYGVKDKDTPGEGFRLLGGVDELEIVVSEETDDYENPFTDVEEGTFYYDAVKWAVKKGVTTGTTETTFSPDNMCLRGQVVTFLWRKAGNPEPKVKKNPFTDVTENDFFYEAVLWAYGEGITTGTSDTTFSPNTPCLRGQVVTFLWRAAGKPAPTVSNNPFADVGSDEFYYEPVLWAYENKITTGTTDTTFSPDNFCLRGQVVTFLYRAS